MLGKSFLSDEKKPLRKFTIEKIFISSFFFFFDVVSFFLFSFFILLWYISLEVLFYVDYMSLLLLLYYSAWCVVYVILYYILLYIPISPVSMYDIKFKRFIVFSKRMDKKDIQYTSFKGQKSIFNKLLKNVCKESLDNKL